VTGDATDGSVQLDEVARRANVPSEFVRRLAALDVLSDDLSIAVRRELGRVRLLYAWSQAGFPPETIMRLVGRNALSITFLDAPAVQAPRRLDRRYEDIAAERGVPGSLVERLHESIGFEPPNPHDRAGEDDLALLDAMELFRGVGVPDEAVVRLFAVYADAGRRVAKAEAELYEANIEEHLRASGMTQRELIEFSTNFGNRVSAALEKVLVMVYRRHRVHAWTEHSVTHVEAALETEGIEGHIPQPPAICFVDLTGYTRLTEERGDRFAADAVRAGGPAQGESGPELPHFAGSQLLLRPIQADRPIRGCAPHLAHDRGLRRRRAGRLPPAVHRCSRPLFHRHLAHARRASPPAG